jgi:hypothetical protein
MILAMAIVDNGGLTHTDETSSLGVVVLADSTQRLNPELCAVKLADLEL